MIVFIIGSLLAGFAPSILSLIIFRGIAGAGGGGIVSMVQIVMSDVVSLRERGKYQGILVRDCMARYPKTRFLSNFLSL